MSTKTVEPKAVSQPKLDIENAAAISKNKPVASVTRPGVFIDLYSKTTKEGKDGVFAVLKRRYQKKEGNWEDTPFFNSLSDFDNAIEALMLAKIQMRDFYSQRNAADNAA